MQRRSDLIAFLSDFGSDSPYPGIVRGVIHGIHPRVCIVDLTHSVPSFDVTLGAFFLCSSLPWFPEGSIFLSVVDPGVGGAREALIVMTRRYTLVGPDNGIMYPAAASDGIVAAYKIVPGEYTFHTGCETFHGRDIFAPVASHLSLGVAPEKLGERVEGIVQIELPGQVWSGDTIEGTVLFVDSFGNVITSIQSSTFHSFAGEKSEFLINGLRAVAAGTFSDVASGLPALVPGSFERIEICINRGDASSNLGLYRGDRVEISRT
ncbi:MAG: hypothetical protein GTN70_06965 [Deltaproteobacteria bacterium]|nr:hypothetical protein [Deltaproteobacteria bacterium]NIS77436.1 hypothetical protein [Deltaproteobacteria bacterium]